MKITRERLKDIIKEETENLQKEGWFGRMKAGLFGSGDKAHGPAIKKYEAAIASVTKAYNRAETEEELRGFIRQLWDADKAYEAAMQKSTGDQAAWSQSLNKDQRHELDGVIALQQRTLDRIRNRAEEAGMKAAAEMAEKAKREKAARADRERRAAYKRHQDAERDRKDRRDYTKDRPNVAMGFRGDAYSEKERYGESKITKSVLKAMIAEELTAAEKDKKAELEKELDTLNHK